MATSQKAEADQQSSSEDVSLPDPHPAQAQVLAEARRFNVLCCGRRWGKTLLAQRLLAQAANDGQPVAYLCPTYKMLYQTWRDLCDALPSARRIVSERRLELQSGGSIDMWSGDDMANAIRGRKYALVILDEAAMIPGLIEAWEKSIRPTLTDLKGSAWFISTPRRGGGFQTLFDSTEQDWRSWQEPTSRNPFIDPQEIEAARASLSQQSFAQEYLADFEAAESELVHHLEPLRHVHGPKVAWADCIARVVGIDPGGGDPTAIVPIGVWKETRAEAMNAGTNFQQYGEFYRRGDVTSEDIISYLARLHQAGPLTKIIVAETGGNIITNTLLRAGFPAERFLGTREAGLQNVNWLLETGRLGIDPSCTNSIAEFANYRWAQRRDGTTGERYATSTPQEHHADAMDARRCALLWAVTALEQPQQQVVPMKWIARGGRSVRRAG